MRGTWRGEELKEGMAKLLQRVVMVEEENVGAAPIEYDPLASSARARLAWRAGMIDVDFGFTLCWGCLLMKMTDR